MDSVTKLEKLNKEMKSLGDFLTTQLDRKNQTLTIYETTTHFPLYRLTLAENGDYKLIAESTIIESKSGQRRPDLDLTYYSLLLGLIYNYVIEE